jgi:thiol-disulfide isomerase/thioredoxin
MRSKYTMKRTLTTIAGLCAGFVVLASPTLAGPEHSDHKMSDKEKMPSLEEIVGEVKLPELFIGSSAPDLQIAKFVKGDSVQQFEDGKVYVVEFWATWCGPCIAAFPHLSELQAEHKEDVQFIGVNIWEGVDDQAQRISKVENFVEDQGERMSYTVAVENGTAMADTWMKPAGQNGIPAAFIVDGKGKIAWVGHPMSMDEPLENVLSGNFNEKQAIADYKKQNLMMAGYQKFMTGFRSGDNIEEATMIAQILMKDYFQDEPGGLNAIAWTLLSSNSDKVTEEHTKLAYKAAKQACEASEWNEWMILDTYALACHKLGKNEEAVKWQTKAIELLPEENAQNKPELEESLAKYKAAG